MLSAAGYGSMIQHKLSVSLPPTLRTSTGLVVLVVANQALIALQVRELVNPSTAAVTAGLALLVFHCHGKLRRLHPRTKEGPLSRDSLICLGATGVLLVDHSPAWGFALAVLGGIAILALFPSKNLRAVGLTTVASLLILRVANPPSGFYLVSDDISFTEAYSYLSSQFGPHEWYGALGIAAPYHWFGFGTLGVFASQTSISDVYPTALLAVIVVSSLFPLVVAENIRSDSANSRVLVWLVPVLCLSGSFSYQFSPSTTWSILLFVTTLGIIRRTSNNRPNLTLFLIITALTFAMTSTKATMMLGIPVLFVVIASEQRATLTSLAQSASVMIGALTTLVMTYDVLNLWSFQEYALTVTFRGGFTNILESGSYLQLQTLLALALVAVRPVIGVIMTMLSVIATFVAESTGTSQSHYFIWTVIWISVVLLAIELRTATTGQCVDALIFMSLIAVTSRLVFGSWTTYRWDGRFPNLPPAMPVGLLGAAALAATISLLSRLSLVKLPARLLVASRNFFGTTLVLVLLLILALGKVSLLAERWQSFGSRFASEIDLDTPQRLVGNTMLTEAATWIRRNTPSDAIIATNHLCDISSNDASCDLDGESPVAALTRRRTLLEAPRYAAGLLDEPQLNRQGEVSYPAQILSVYRASLTRDDAGGIGTADSLLRQHGVSYYLYDLKGPLVQIPTDSEVRFANDDFRVFLLSSG